MEIQSIFATELFIAWYNLSVCVNAQKKIAKNILFLF